MEARIERLTTSNVLIWIILVVVIFIGGVIIHGLTGTTNELRTEIRELKYSSKTGPISKIEADVDTLQRKLKSTELDVDGLKSHRDYLFTRRLSDLKERLDADLELYDQVLKLRQRVQMLELTCK